MAMETPIWNMEGKQPCENNSVQGTSWIPHENSTSQIDSCGWSLCQIISLQGQHHEKHQQDDLQCQVLITQHDHEKWNSSESRVLFELRFPLVSPFGDIPHLPWAPLLAEYCMFHAAVSRILDGSVGLIQQTSVRGTE